MGHPLPVVDRETYDKFNACVHCGLCLPVCPTYAETQDEADSPRGRIHLMKAAVDGRIKTSDVVFEHLDRCLVCRACEPACPSGVEYHALIEAVRPQVAEIVLGKGKRMRSGMLQWVVGHVLPEGKRVGAAMAGVKVARKMGLGGLVEKLAPGTGALAEAAKGNDGGEELAAYTPGRGTRRGEVVLLRGCVGGVVSGEVNRACVEVLARNGFGVRVLGVGGGGGEPCCGALAMHANDPAGAKGLARRWVEVMEARGGPGGADYFVSPIAGCGAHLKGLDKALAGEGDFAERAVRVVGRMRDICELLVEVGIERPTGRVEKKVTYHDPCHLAHGQRIVAAPRRLLGMVPGLEVVGLEEGDMCCGAAGTYSLNQPGMAERLGRRKVGHILETGAEELVTANVGCALQIARHLKERGKGMRVRHVVEVVAESYRVGG